MKEKEAIPLGKLVELIAKALVDRPTEVVVDCVNGRSATVIELRVHPDDRKLVIGRKGRTADALRQIINSASGKLNRRHVLEIIQ